MYKMILTTKGYELIQESIGSIGILNLSKFIFADNEDEIKEDMETLNNIVYENYITNREDLSVKEIELQTIIPLWDGGFNINKVGLLDEKDNLIAVGEMPETYVPNIEEGATKEIDIKVRINIESANNIEITIDPTVTLVTQDKLDSVMGEILHLIDNKVEYSELDDAIEELIGEAPETLDTLYELAEALGNDPNFATTVAKELGNKVNKEDGKSLSSNDFTDELKLKLETMKIIEKVGDLKQDIPYLLDKDLNPLEEDIVSNTNLIHSEITKVMDMIDNIDIPEVDLTNIEEELQRLEEEKANKSDVKDALENVVKIIEEYLTEQLEVINKAIDGKADQSEIERLELMIKDIIEGEDRKYVIPRITPSPILNEIYYQSKPLDKPVVAWYGDDWGSWNVEDIEHLKLDSHGSYSGAECRVRTGDGVMEMDFVKEDPNRPYSIKQTRNGKVILDTGYIRENKKHKLYIKAGDKINVLAAFKGDVYISYEGYQSDLRLSAYKNGKVEEIANKRLVEERLEDFTLKDEFESKVGKLDSLTTKEKSNLVDAINYLMRIKADDEDLEEVLDAFRIVTEDLINKVLHLDVVKAEKGYVDDKLSEKANKEDVPTLLSQLTNDDGYVKVQNLICNTTYYKPPSLWGRGTTVEVVKGFPNSAIVYRGENANNYGITTDYRTDLIKGREYTLSFEYRTNDVTEFDYMYIMRKSGGNSSIRPSFQKIIPDGKWHKASGTFKAPKNDKNIGIMFASRYGTSFEIRKMQLEIGSTATEWFPQYEDLYNILYNMDIEISDKTIEDESTSNEYEFIVKDGIPYLEVQ